MATRLTFILAASPADGGLLTGARVGSLGRLMTLLEESQAALTKLLDDGKGHAGVLADCDRTLLF